MVLLINYFFKHQSSKCKPVENSNFIKIHMSYVHYLNTKDERTIQNFKFFFHFAYEPCHSEVDYTITLNVDNFEQSKPFLYVIDFLKSTINDITITNQFKSCSNISNPKRNTYLIVRENKPGGDLCAHADLFKSDFWLKNKLNYKYYFFINSAARGPFLPNYWLKKWLVRYFYLHLPFMP